MNHAPALLVGRILASLIFILSGYGKAMAMAGTVGYLGSKGVPMPNIAYFLVVAVELGGGLLFLVGFQTRIVAVILALWCIATAIIGHQDFTVAGNMINFEKNLAMAGGFLAFVAAGAGRFSIDAAMRRQPMAV
jgi:putative oxidoreductase